LGGASLDRKKHVWGKAAEENLITGRSERRENEKIIAAKKKKKKKKKKKGRDSCGSGREPISC